MAGVGRTIETVFLPGEYYDTSGQGERSQQAGLDQDQVSA